MTQNCIYYFCFCFNWVKFHYSKHSFVGERHQRPDWYFGQNAEYVKFYRSYRKQGSHEIYYITTGTIIPWTDVHHVEIDYVTILPIEITVCHRLFQVSPIQISDHHLQKQHHPDHLATAASQSWASSQEASLSSPLIRHARSANSADSYGLFFASTEATARNRTDWPQTRNTEN